MKIWLFLTGIIISLIIIFMFANQRKHEGFVGDFGNVQNSYMQNQRNWFWNDDKQLTVFDTMNINNDINKALQAPDLFKQTQTFPEGKIDYTQLFRKKSTLEQDVENCKTLTSPTQINRGSSQTHGCGWVYSDDSNVPSVAAYGDFEGPSFPSETTKKIPNGQWIFDKNEAIKKEEIKACRQIKTCPGIGGVIQGGLSCGFCNDSNNKGGVPIQNGNVKYMNDDKGGCSNVITNTGNCPTIVTNEVGSETSVNPDCNISLWEDRIENGLIKTYIKGTNRQVDVAACSGSSSNMDNYSGSGSAGTQDDVNSGAGLGGVNACIPVRGQLTKECFKQKAKELGFFEDGRYFKIIESKFNRIKSEDDLPFEEDKLAFTVLRNVSPTLSFSIFGGNITVDALTTLLTNINSNKNSQNKRIKDAVAWFQIGTPFEKCEYSDSDTGPFLLNCMQQEFRKAGCQPAGLAYPKASNQNSYNANTWKDLKSNFSKIYQQMTTSGSKFKKQDEAVRNCLGTNLFRPRIEACEENGIEYLVYNGWPAKEHTFLGRFISKVGNYTFRTGCGTWDYSYPMGEKYFPVSFPGCNQIGNENTLIIRTVKTPKKDETLTFTLTKLKNQNPLFINNIAQTNFTENWQWNNEHGVKYTVPLTGKVPYTIEYRKIGITHFPCDQFNSNTLKEFQLKQDSWKPVVGYDFINKQIIDSNDVIKMKQPESRPTYGEQTIDEIQRGFINITKNKNIFTEAITNIKGDVIKTITLMVNVNTENTTGAIAHIINSKHFKISVVCTSPTKFKINVMRKHYKSSVRTSANMEIVELSSPEENVNKWVHFTVRFGKNSLSILNNNFGGPRSDVEYTNPPNESDYLTHTLNLFNDDDEKATLNMKLAWLHFYDYQLNSREIDRDINYDDDSYVMPEVQAPPKIPEFGCKGVEYGKMISRSSPNNIQTLGPLYTGPTAKSLQECCTLCKNNPNCKAFEHIYKYNQCQLYSKAEGGLVNRPFNYEGYLNDSAYIKP